MGLYNIKNIAQIKALEDWFLANRCATAHGLFNVLRYVNNCEMNSVLKIKRDDAISYIDLGVMLLNRSSKRQSATRVVISSDLDNALRAAVSTSEGKKYLFSASLFGSNRSASMDSPITRQAVWKMFDSAKGDVCAALRDSGQFDVMDLFGAQSLINFNQGDSELKNAISSLVSTYGDRMSSDTLLKLKIELDNIRKREPATINLKAG